MAEKTSLRKKLMDSETWGPIYQKLVSKVIAIVSAIVFLFVAHFVASMFRSWLFRAGRRQRQKSLTPVANPPKQPSSIMLAYISLGHIVYWAVIAGALLTTFRILGLETSSFLAILGTIGFALGLAMQGALSDVAAGILLSMFRAYDLEDVVEVNGQVGYVNAFNLFTTVIEDAATGALVAVPNRSILGSSLTNINKQPVVAVVYDILLANKNDNFQEIVSTLRREIQKMPGVLSSPAVAVGVLSMREPGTVIRVQAYVDSLDVIAQRAALPTQTRYVLEKMGVRLGEPVATR